MILNLPDSLVCQLWKLVPLAVGSAAQKRPLEELSRLGCWQQTIYGFHLLPTYATIGRRLLGCRAGQQGKRLLTFLATVGLGTLS